ncbi:hypothetical protein AB3N02_21690 [Priestia aryabhattai]|uniref:hypothetical protein n=1 Tax=Priestia aryabhattai TaxID=412384 RepID=UPI0039A10B61
MTNINNDERILELKKQIEAKKEKLGKVSRFIPVTNCSIEFDGKRHNLHALQHEDLISLLVKLNMHLISAKGLGLEETYKISNYLVSEWMVDINARIDILSKKDEERKLKLMENKLVELLSEKKKVELEIDEIESLLKD